MTFQVINSPIADQIIKALCNTLVHSLWQGLLLAAVAGLIVIFTKRSSSAIRYNLLISALALFAVGTVITFMVQFNSGYNVDVIAGQPVNFIPQNTFAIAQPFHNSAIQSESMASILSGYLNTYHNSIVLIWFLIICAKSMQLGVGLYGTYQLKRVNVVAAGSYWTERVQQLACLLGVGRTISLLESGIAKVPMVIGHLKPVILMPIGLLTALSAEEVEAILVHELAHIKRRDYLVNMLQSLMEIIFFFNPAVLWISQLIKTERENCCDDMVVAQSSNKISYIRALVSCGEYQAAVPAYAMAFPGSKNSLLDRVKRLATNRNHSLNLFEKTLLAVCLVVSGLCMSAFAERDNIKRTVKEVVKMFGHGTFNSEQKQKLVEQTDLLKEETAKMRASTPLLTAIPPRLQIIADTNRKVKVNVQPILAINSHINPLFASLSPAANVMLPIFNLLGDYDYGDTTKKVQVPNVNVHLDPMNVQVSNVNVHLAPLKLNVQTPNVNVHLDPLNVQLANVNVHLDPLNISLGKVDTNSRGRGAAANRPFHEIARDLFKLHIITDTNHFSISLNENELSVNGVKQSDEVRKQIYEKYGNVMRGTTFVSYYSKSNGSSNPASGSYSNNYSNSNSYSNSGAGSGSYNYSYPDTDIRKPVAPKAPKVPTLPTTPTALTPPKLQAAPKAPVVPKAPAYADERKNNEDVKKILADLDKDRLISNHNHISFLLNNNEFILNGKKQSDEVFQKYKKKYYPQKAGETWTWSHSYNNDTAPE